jgi:hypothetical protein
MADRNDRADVADIKRDPANARAHTARNIGLITDSIEQCGFGRSILIDEDDTLIAGEGAVEAAMHAGLRKVRIIDTEGDEIIAVRRTNLTPEQKRKLAIYDNRANELSEWNPDVLRDLAEHGDLPAGVFTPAELQDIVGGGGEAEPVERVTVERAQDVAWVLLAIPLEDWPKHQPAVEAMQLDAAFTTTVIRPKSGAAGTHTESRKDPL